MNLVSPQDLRQRAIANTLFPPTSLQLAVERMGFVQADPIRSPARAQDLILRQRVEGYRAGDIEREYHALELEEDRFYAYGFMPRTTWALLHPRSAARLSAMEKRVLKITVERKRVHPADLEEHLGRKRKINAWGSHSKATTLALESLHYGGHLRVAGRKNGIREYEPAVTREEALDRAARYRKLALLIVSILGPISDRSLRATLYLAGLKLSADPLLKSGELIATTVDGIRYLTPADGIVGGAPRESVRFLAPFDPLVWDRARFEHLWGWQYRFEAYTPVAKRQLGYYAMPLLWRDDVIGWVNASNAGDRVTVEAGFKKSKPKERAFRVEFEAEVERLRRFLKQ